MTEVEKIIRKHHRNRDKWTPKRNWEKCGVEIQNLIKSRQEAIREKNLPYPEQCRREAEVRNRIEKEYEKYFGFKNLYGVVTGYDWINGNDKLKELIA